MQYLQNVSILAQPVLASLGAHTLLVVTLVVVSDGEGQHLGCPEVVTSQICHLIALVRQGRGCNSEKKTLRATHH